MVVNSILFLLQLDTTPSQLFFRPLLHLESVFPVSPLHMVGRCRCADSLLVEANFLPGWIVVFGGNTSLGDKR